MSEPKPGDGHEIIPYRFKPGVSGNPGGAPKGKKLSTCLRDMMDMTAFDLKMVIMNPSATNREYIAARWVLKMRGVSVDGWGNQEIDMRALEAALDRLEGSVAQTMNIKSPADRAGKSDAELATILARCQIALRPVPPS